MPYTANIIGATGLVGKLLVSLLLNDSECQELHILVRRPSGFSHPKLKEHRIDFDQDLDYIKAISGHVLFSCLGTTLAQAGSKQAQRKVDYDYQLKAARAAKVNGLQNYVLVSSPYAKLHARNYYRHMKAELEVAIEKLQFGHTTILQPGGLIGKREKPRKGETMGLTVMKWLTENLPFLRKYSPIDSGLVAKAMYHAYKRPSEMTLRRVSWTQINELAQ
ncbi:NAD(P)H-binding protein [Sediminicola luteus]|uniref:NAD(P)-binding domain-containing protein n=1 Tax=Sediminicola luteus TaxID=319238 RepID=A0A2A4G1S6_9FLAO|nr:NAD(P)H-binding protein [Sediminicola luteus]PCE62929.1 hypothetical protein B7P33_16775 [Sediminicola luteus]